MSITIKTGTFLKIELRDALKKICTTNQTIPIRPRDLTRVKIYRGKIIAIFFARVRRLAPTCLNFMLIAILRVVTITSARKPKVIVTLVVRYLNTLETLRRRS